MTVAAQPEQDRLRLRRLPWPPAPASIVNRIAWVGSGAGRMPSVRAKVTAASNAAVCLTACASISPSSRGD